MSGWPDRGGMQSTTVTTPSAVVNVVSRTRLSGRYWRVVRTTGSSGVRSQRPWSSVPRSAAKQAGESKRGKQSQSIDPLTPTRAAVWQSPMSA
jgi:hypothetical protein